MEVFLPITELDLIIGLASLDGLQVLVQKLGILASFRVTLLLYYCVHELLLLLSELLLRTLLSLELLLGLFNLLSLRKLARIFSLMVHFLLLHINGLLFVF